VIAALPGSLMANDNQTAQPEDQAASETARVSKDLMEMMREICFHTKDDRGKRLKLTQLLDNLLRPAVRGAYNEFRRKREKEEPGHDLP
jgi:hypothetical protein